MGYEIAPRERGTANNGTRQNRLSAKELDEFSASFVQMLYRDITAKPNDERPEKSVREFIKVAEKMHEGFRSGDSKNPLTKYRYAEIYLQLYEHLSELEITAGYKSPDGILIEYYTDWGADPDKPGELKVERKARPWTQDNPKSVKEIPLFNDKNVTEVKSFVMSTNPGMITYEEADVEEDEYTPPTPSEKTNFPFGFLSPIEDEAPNTPPAKVPTLVVSYSPNARLVELLTVESKYDYGSIRVEDFALAVRALSVKKMDMNKAREIAKAYLVKYVDADRENFRDRLVRNYDQIKKDILYVKKMQADIGISDSEAEDSGLKVIITFHFSYFSALNLHFEYHVDIGEYNTKLLTGEIQKELNSLYKLDRIDKNLRHYFQTLERKDFGTVLRSVAFSRQLMASVLEGDFKELKDKRSSLFFRAFEATFLDNEFPSDLKSFFKSVDDETIAIYALIKNDEFEKAIAKSRQLFEVFLEAKEKLEAYERDKIAWGGRAIFLMTLVIEVLITYLTAGVTKIIPARAGLLLNLLLPAVKQELYLQIGVISKRDFKQIGIDAVVNVAAMKIATSLTGALTEVYNIPISRFKAVVIDNLLVNFLAAMQQEIVNMARKAQTLDDFLENVFKNFVTGVIHEKFARVAISRARKDGLDYAVRKNDPNFLAAPDRDAHLRLTARPTTEIIPAPQIEAVPSKIIPGNRDAQGITNTGIHPEQTGFTSIEGEIDIHHGTSINGKERIDRNGFGFDPDNVVNNDLGKGVYFALDPNLAETAGKRKTSGQVPVLGFTVKGSDLGKIVDVRPGGKHRPLFEKFLEEEADGMSWSPKKYTNKEIILTNPESRSDIFESFLKKYKLQDAETILGPVGDEYTSGSVVSTDATGKPAVGTQLVIRSNNVLHKINHQIQESRKPSLFERFKIPRGGLPITTVRGTENKIGVIKGPEYTVAQVNAHIRDAQKMYVSEEGARGQLLIPNEKPLPLKSGEDAGVVPGTKKGGFPRGQGYGFTSGGNSQGNIATHIEGHTAAIMWQRKLKYAELIIDRPPCKVCDHNLSSALPPGAQLDVIFIEGGIVQRTIYRSNHGE